MPPIQEAAPSAASDTLCITLLALAECAGVDTDTEADTAVPVTAGAKRAVEAGAVELMVAAMRAFPDAEELQEHGPTLLKVLGAPIAAPIRRTLHTPRDR